MPPRVGRLSSVWRSAPGIGLVLAHLSLEGSDLYMRTLLLSILMFGLLAVRLPAQQPGPEFEALWHDPEVQQRIDAGIRANRMGYAKLHFEDASGKPLDGVSVSFRQTTHDFLFGSNIFALNGFSTAKENRRYEDLFASTFNFATVPFYWSDLEPEPGHPRYAKDSPPIARRPPPDAVVEFCLQHHIAMRGHNLIWHYWYPTWLPNDQAEVTKYAARRFASIGARYGKKIGSWDVVNEPLERPANVLLPKDYVYWAMTEATRDFPSSAKLDINETGAVWTHFHEEDSPFYLLLENLRLRGARVDDIGLQFHLFNKQLYKNVLAGKAMKPLDMLRVLDFYQKLQLPISISEITIPTLPCTVEGEATQAELVRDYYRLWFSHPAVKAITWWNLADDTAYGPEDSWCGGLLRKDLSPKASFTVLQNLIQKEWHTEGSLKSGTDSDLEFQGFYGEYEITATRAGQTVHQTIHLSKTGHNDFTVKLP